MVAEDPATNAVVKNVSFQVYAVTDTSFSTPLPITDTFNNPLAGGILNSGTKGVFPQFQQATNSTVVIADATKVYAWTINCVQQDSAISSFINTPGSATATALSATYAPASGSANYAAKATTVSAGTGLTGGGDLSANRTLTVAYGTAAGTAAQGNDSRITGAAQAANNLSDLANSATARTNLGLGDSATHPASDFAQIAADNVFTTRQDLQGGLVLGSPSVSTMPPGAIRALVPQSYTDNPGDNIAFNFQSIIYGDWTPDTGIDPGFVWGTNFYTITGTSSGSANGVAYMYSALIESDVRAPAGSHLGIVIGLQAEAAFADAASGALVDDMRSLLVAAPVRKDGATAGTATKAYGMYVQKVTTAAVGATEAYSIYVQGGLTRLTGRTEINSEAAGDVGLIIKQYPSASTDAFRVTDTFGNVNVHMDQFGQIASSNNHLAYEGQAGQTIIGRIGPSSGSSKESGISMGTLGDAKLYRSATATIAVGSGTKLDGVPGVALATTSYNPGSLATLTTTSTTFADIDTTNAAVTFTVPLSGKVTVRASALIRNQTAGQAVKMNVRNGGSDVSGTGSSMTQESVAGRRLYITDVTGLTPGASVTLTLGWRVVGGTGEITAGGATDVGPLRIDVAAA